MERKDLDIRRAFNHQIQTYCYLAMRSEYKELYMQELPAYIHNVTGFLFTVGTFSYRDMSDYFKIAEILKEEIREMIEEKAA